MVEKCLVDFFIVLACYVQLSQERDTQRVVAVAKDGHDSIQTLRVATDYVTFDYHGAQLTGDNQYHKAFFALKANPEMGFEDLCIVDTFYLKLIKATANDSFARVQVRFPKAVEIRGYFETMVKRASKTDTLLIMDQKVISMHMANVGFRAFIGHVTRLSQNEGWSRSRTKRILSRIQKAFREIR